MLEVRFKSGRTYRYYATESFYKEFLAAPSKGQFVHQRLRHLPYRRIQ
ncbi:KTSC domain-containing protein [Anaerovibrio sp.]|nr:KTSC domain-containing protein [Anaerovibrio sp.]